jgi:hypothetical protein
MVYKHGKLLSKKEYNYTGTHFINVVASTKYGY